jgi:hypothetical protein
VEWWIGENAEGNGYGLVKVFNWDLPGGNEKNNKKASDRIGGVPTDISTDLLKSQELLLCDHIWWARQIAYCNREQYICDLTDFDSFSASDWWNSNTVANCATCLAHVPLFCSSPICVTYSTKRLSNTVCQAAVVRKIREIPHVLCWGPNLFWTAHMTASWVLLLESCQSQGLFLLELESAKISTH